MPRSLPPSPSPSDPILALSDALAQARSIRSGALAWIKTAKTPETRTKRIPNETTAAAQSLRLSPYRR
jgi:hypothetical protein